MNRYRRLEEMMNAEGLSDQEVKFFEIFHYDFKFVLVLET
jgi:hypothetical protein